ncbi:MAG: argininosuccinate lyase [Coriobacteriia bacterium]|nr:argininosuccinate lyase [Coriobacteriia bacterium]
MADGRKTPWGGRFEKAPSALIQEFGASLPVDRRMWREDIDGSRAHAKMLGKIGVLSSADVEAIEKGLGEIVSLIESGEFVWDIEDEDVHMAIEKKLTELIGTAGARLHTGRSRNDQVATDTRLYCKKREIGLMHEMNAARSTLIDLAKKNMSVYMPGYTHLQKAQPILFSHHMLAYAHMFSRDFKRVMYAYEASDVSPLGSAALAGTTFPLDRRYSADLLGFDAISQNSLDAVSDRDFLLDLAYACSTAQMHLSRLSEEIVLWSSDEFGFITLDDGYSTGSSIMPQKKNPDFAELVRGKTGRVYGDLLQLLVMLKGLPLAYNKDMQEDKEGVFDAIDTVENCLIAMRGMLSTLTVNEDVMKVAAHGGFMAATDLADYLVGTGMPFRQAHEVVGEIVLQCEKEGKSLQELTAEEYFASNHAFKEDVLEAVSIENAVGRRTSFGGTAPDSVRTQLETAERMLDSDMSLVDAFSH